VTLPRRIQLVKLLRANGLRDVERMREDELREALARLRVVVPDPKAAERGAPSSGAFLARPADPPPFVDDSDDPWALPRFREPKLFLPDGERTFLRAIAVKPRLLFCTWDVRSQDRAHLEGPVELQLSWRDFLGDAPGAGEVLRQEPFTRIPIELSSAGWYVTIPGDRIAVTASLVVVGQEKSRRLAESNVTLAPPARPAPPGPYWLATLPPSLDRRRLKDRSLMKGEVGDLRRVGETDARGLDDLDDEALPASATAMRVPWLQTMPSSASSGSSPPSSGSLPSSGALPSSPASGPRR
jgi:hypothetical protein